MNRTCPGCDGPISRKAALCAVCRKKANTVGASVLTHVHDAAAPTAPSTPRTPQQNTVYHAKCADIARAAKIELRAVKSQALGRAEQMFDRPFESSTELTELEMERLLEWLDDRLDAARAHAAA